MKEVIAYIHTHWDREWYREFQEFRLRLIEVFDEVLDALSDGSLPCFFFDGQVSAVEDYLEIRCDKKALVKQLIKEKKLYIGPFYCSSDSFLVSGESLLRNLQLGIESSKKFGENEFIAYIADSFGHSKDLPALLKYFDLSDVILWRGLGNLSADLSWNGINVTNLIQGYFQDFLHSPLPIEKKAENLKRYLDKISEYSSNTILLPIGADHLAAVKNIINIIDELNKIYTDYKIIIGSPFDYIKKITNREKTEGEFLDNEKTFLLKGVYSSRPKIKKENALCQWLLTRIAEPLNSLSSKFYSVKNKQSEINYAYKELIKNQAHDSIYGCSLDEVENDVLARYNTVKTIANGVIKRTVRDLSNDNGKLTVINLSNYEYSGKILIETEKDLKSSFNPVKIASKKGFTDKKLYNINDIPITEDITDINTYMLDVKNLPPFSITKITKDKICSENYIKTDKNSIENKFIKIKIQDNQIIVTDKKLNEKYGNFIVFQDSADIGDSYNFGALKKDIPINADIKSFNITSDNIKAVLNIIYEIKIPLISNTDGRSHDTDNCLINTEFILYNQSEFAEIRSDWVNNSKNHILRIGFNLKDKITSTISEDLFSTVKRNFDPDYDIYKHIPAKRGIELKTNTAPFQRFVNTGNLTLITLGINEYEVNKNTLYLTLLRATGIISNPSNPCRGTPAGPPLETPNLQSTGKNTCHLAFAFTKNESEMYKFTEEFYNPCICLFTNKQDTILLKSKNRVFSVTADKNKLIAKTWNNITKQIQTEYFTVFD